MDMDTTYLILMQLPIIAIVLLALLYYRKIKNDTLQQNGSNVGHLQEQSSGKLNDDENTIQKPSKTKSGKNHGANINKRHQNDKTHSHPWLVTTLKGHTDDIHDMDFSSNGKYLASCAEDNLIRNSNGHQRRTHSHRHSRSNTNGHHNRTTATSDLITNDDVNSSSSNEDNISTTYNLKEKIKKTTKSGRQRRNQRKNQNGKIITTTITTPPSSPASSSSSSSSSSICKTTKSRNSGQPNVQILNGTTIARTIIKSEQSNYDNTNIINDTNNIIDNNFEKISRALTPPLRQHTKLNLHESELVKFLRYYLIDPNLLRVYGYPVENSIQQYGVEIFKCPPRPFMNHKTQYDITYSNTINIINQKDGLYNNSDCIQQLSGDSGRGSGSSSPPSIDSDTSENGEEDTTSSTTKTTITTATTISYYNNFDCNYQQYSQQYLYPSFEKKCVRCQRSFMITENGEYLTQEECTYHWGKLNQVYTQHRGLKNQYTCCNGGKKSNGCVKNRLHVWTGVSVGINGPYDDYVSTSDSNMKNDDKCYAIDCEMCFTGLGLELAKITVISSDGQLVYEHFVRPESEVVDYNTRFSGITEKDLSIKNVNVKTLKQVQTDLLKFINSNTILIGHALDNDFRVLKFLHKNVIDTSITFPHVSGFPYRRALKTLTKMYLNRDIQTGDNGHSSFEDSRACLELMLWRVRKDFRPVLEQ